MARRDTDQILSYYQSEHAGRDPDLHAQVQDSKPNTSPHADRHDRTRHSESSPSHRSPSRLPPPSNHARKNSKTALAPAPPLSSYVNPEPRASLSALPLSTHTHDVPELPTPHSTRERERTSGSTGSGRAAGSDRSEFRHSRRPSVPTEGGADRRRLAIVEMDTPLPASLGRKRSNLDGRSNPSATDSPPSRSSARAHPLDAMPGGTLFARRGVHIGGLALVAPPDAAPSSYQDLTPPPSTAPLVSTGSKTTSAKFAATHARSASEAVDGGRARLARMPSRDVGIVGLHSGSSASESAGPASPGSDDLYGIGVGDGSVPVFQTPGRSRPPSPGHATDARLDRLPQRLFPSPLIGMDDADAGMLTPPIGQGKDIRQPVVGPVIVGLSPELLRRDRAHPGARHPQAQSPASSSGSSSVQSPSSSSTSFPSPFLHYHPGLHATAGPLPPPPRSIFDTTRGDPGPPPRPPRYHTPIPNNSRRDIDAIKEALQLPQSVSAKLAARTPPVEDREDKLEGQPPKPEGSTGQERSKARSMDSVYSDEAADEPSVKLVSAPPPAHRREGAFPPSRFLSSSPSKQSVQSPLPSQSPPQIDEATPASSRGAAGGRPVVVVEQDEPEEETAKSEEEVPRRPAIDLERESSWASLRESVLTKRHSSPNGKTNMLQKPSPEVVSRSPSVSHLPSLPPKSIRGWSDDEKSTSLAPSSFKVLTSLKRFSSLPRTPSRSSRSSKRSSTDDPRRSLSPPPPTPPPQIHVQSPPRKRMVPKIKYVHSWPPAMNPAEIVSLRGSRERAQMYAMKINELSQYDCGLRNWLQTQHRGSLSQPSTQASHRGAHHAPHASLPAEFGAVPSGLRNVSHGSMASEATFPIRADAYTATDLSTRPSDVFSSAASPPNLPYPALAQVQISTSRSPARASTLLLSPTKALGLPLPLSGARSGTGFFADKPTLGAPSGRLLKQRPPGIAQAHSSPQPSTSTPPSIPGGPRSAPGRIARAKTSGSALGSTGRTSNTSSRGGSASPPRPAGSTSPQRQSASVVAASRRPSLFARARQGHASVVPHTARGVSPAGRADLAFEREVDRLADLLPHAERQVLAGYLRRAGQDMLAIGQYLEDEKNGTLRRD
ncbi:uncharacterized protein BXZ73DRAFT_87461 [Epithele typhae]|uniref:uncharacterized protein n=1 Tax=Epithele typhae TaxID=378194 RepID=UPI002007865E|nr:uncharacterized protein BXZ73DRAFT_87461 [Epithele typhae]KAH9943018.1 hypothetical protein BXZ73DRAFT_87461 [Epithele typhae]